jgi:predicted nucleic acid-binding protein
MSQPSSAGAVVIDANILISLCTKEPHTFTQANAAFNDYAQKGWTFHAPNVIVAEALFVFCRKLQDGQLSESEHAESIEFLIDYMALITVPASGDASLLPRAEDVRSGYGCARSADGLYIAQAEELAKQFSVEILTLDDGYVNQVAKNATSVKVNFLPS